MKQIKSLTWPSVRKIVEFEDWEKLRFVITCRFSAIFDFSPAEPYSVSGYSL